MKSFITGFIGSSLGLVGEVVGGSMMATGLNPGYIGDHLHRAGTEFAAGMGQRAEELAKEEAAAAALAEEVRHEERCMEIALEAAAEQQRHAKATGADI